MAKTYELQVRGLNPDSEIETVRVYFAEYAPDSLEEDRIAPDASSSFVDRLWADYAPIDANNNRRIDLLALGVFTNRQAYYKLAVSFLNDEGDESAIVAVEGSLKLEAAPNAPGFVQLYIENA